MDLEQVYELAAYQGFLGEPPGPKYANHTDDTVCLAYRYGYEEFIKEAQYPTYPPMEQGAPQGDPQGGAAPVNPNAIPEGGEPETPAESQEESPSQENEDDARTVLHSLEQDLNTTEQEMEDAHQARNFEAYQTAFKRYEEIAKSLARVRKQLSKESPSGESENSTTTSRRRLAVGPNDLTTEDPPGLNDPNRDEYETIYQKTVEEFGRDPQLKQDDVEGAVHKAYNLLKDTNVQQVNDTEDAFEHVKMFLGKQDKMSSLVVSAEIPMKCPACSKRVAHVNGYFKCASNHWSELVLEPETKTAKYDKSSPPKRINHLPEHEQHKWIAAYNSAADQDNDEESCNRIAWSNVSDKHKGSDSKKAKRASLERAIAQAEEVRHDMDRGYILAWWGGTGITIFNIVGGEVGYYNLSGDDYGNVTPEDAIESMEENIADGDYIDLIDPEAPTMGYGADQFDDDDEEYEEEAPGDPGYYGDEYEDLGYAGIEAGSGDRIEVNIQDDSQGIRPGDKGYVVEDRGNDVFRVKMDNGQEIMMYRNMFDITPSDDDPLEQLYRNSRLKIRSRRSR